MGAEPADVSSDVGGAVVTPAGGAALGAIQGPAELLPISSSAHLSLSPDEGFRRRGVEFPASERGHWDGPVTADG